MYFWAHSEAPAITPLSPRRLSSGLWSSFSSVTDADAAMPQSRPGARYTEAEFQQVVIGLKKEHKENLTRLTRGQEVKLFKLRGEHAHILHEYEKRICELEDMVARLQQELEKQKTLADIQSLTSQTIAEFGSPSKQASNANSPSPKKSPVIHERISNLFPEQSDGPPTPSPGAAESAKSMPSSHASEHSKTNGHVVDANDAKDVGIETEPKALRNESDGASGEINKPLEETSKQTSETTLPRDTSTIKTVPPFTDDVPSSPSSSLPPRSPVISQVPALSPTPPRPPDSCRSSGAPSVMPSSVGSSPSLPPQPTHGLIPNPPPPPSPCTRGPPPPPLPPPVLGGPPPPPLPPPVLGGPPPPPLPPPMLGGPPPPPPPITGGPPPPPAPPGCIAPLPFPTPPAGGWNAQRAELRKQPVNPAVPMKPLYWSRIIVPVNQPIKDLCTHGDETPSPLWEKLEEAKIEDYSEFNELFSRQIITRKPTKKKNSQDQSKQQAAKILDSKRSQNVGILSSSLHVDFSEIENAIYHFDTSMVNLEALQQIYEMRATTEELELIKAHVKTNPEVPLDKPEQFLLELSEIPNFAERIACFMFQSQYEDSINTVDSKLNNMKSTCEMLLNAESVKTVMAIILALGNYMNGGNLTRGQADGFGIEILPKLKDVKSKDSSVTLLHFIVRTYMRKLDDPLNLDLALPVPEPGDINRAAAVDFDEIKSDLQQLEKELKVCQKQTEKVINASSEENLQPFKDKMEAFLLGAQKQILGEFENLEECKIKFKATVNFYQYKPKTEEVVKDFFTTWAPFSKDFKDIWKKEQQRLIKAKMQEFKKKQDVRKQEIKPVKAGGLKDKMKQRLSLGKRS
ncbi:hypothetical protein RUM44_013856 [Polyplax serrata]|uniref:FH2 domain-containing protein n=1 Tax=Polyplax serrata TaxID=468196 RepID=A0ABR1BFB8_POLSC